MPRKSEPKLENCVRELRTNGAALTQAQLAEQVGVTRQTIVALEAGGYVPSLPLAMRIAKAFEKPVEDVFSLAD